MKTQKEIEQLSLQRFPIEMVVIFSKRDKVDKNKERRKIFIETYTQCQKDMANKKYTEEDVINLMFMATKWDTFKDGDVEYEMDMDDFFKYLINSLNKQD